MGLRFQTRLTLTVSALTALTVVTMILLNFYTVASSEIENYNGLGRTYTLLANSNINYSIDSQEFLVETAQDQMVFGALLTAELVYLAEGRLGMAPDDISAILRDAVDRSEAINGRPIVDEIWVTDEDGYAYIHTEDAPYSFSPDPETQPQGAKFYGLLDGSREAVMGELVPRDADGKVFSYVGVTGVDKPRIVQVGVGERAVGKISPNFNVQNVVERFFEALDVSRIAVVDAEGVVIAGAARPGEAPVDGELAAQCADFLASPVPFKLQVTGQDVGVMTRLEAQLGDRPMALYIQYNTEAPVASIRRNLTFVTLVGILTLALATLVCIYLSRSLTRPLGELADGVRAFGRGHLDHRVYLRSHDEIQGLAQTFNAMAGSIQDYMRELEIETQRRERLESELRIAAELQASLLPDAAPIVEGLELVGFSRSAREVGGDFYDYVTYPDGRLGIAIGDATGKGLPAALLTTECWSVFKALAEETDSPAELLYRTNNALCRRMNGSGKFVTLFYMIVDPVSCTARYAAAGHNPPILCGAAEDRAFLLANPGGFPLGLFPNADYVEATLPLTAADTILLYSDGLTEAHSPDDRIYGEERAAGLLRSQCGLTLAGLVDAVRKDVEIHMDGRDLFDDMTLVALRFTGAPVGAAAS